MRSISLQSGKGLPGRQKQRSRDFLKRSIAALAYFIALTVSVTMVIAFIFRIPLGKVHYRNLYTPTDRNLRHHHNRTQKADLE